MTDKQIIELEVDELDGEKVKRLKEELGDEQVKETLETYLTQAIRNLYDNRDDLEVVVPEEAVDESRE